MPLKPGINEARWMAAGAVLLLAVVLLVTHFQKGESPVEQLALKARRLELVNQIRLNLESAAEAEKSAVMAITDEDSQKSADQARAETAKARGLPAERVTGLVEKFVEPPQFGFLGEARVNVLKLNLALERPVF
jgi:hypothetical protein